MRLLQLILLTLFFMLVWNMPVLSAEKNGVVLESVSFQSNAEKGDTITFKLNGVLTPKIFMIKGENPRLVLDFPDTRSSGTQKRNIETIGKLTRKVRIGMHNDQTLKTRVVVDLTPGRDCRYTQHFRAQDNTLMLTFFSAKTDAAPKETGKKEATTKPAQVLDVKEPAPSVQKEHPGASTGAGSAQKTEKKTDTQVAKAGKTVLNQTADKTVAGPESPRAGAPVSEKTDTAAAEMAAAEPSAPAKKESAAASAPDKDALKTAEKGKPAPPVTELTRPSDMPAAGIVSPGEPKNIKPETGEKKTKGEKELQDDSKKESSGAKSTGKKAQPLLSAVTFEITSTKGEMVTFKLNGFYPPKVVGIEKDTPRVICDFPHTLLGGQVKEIIDCHGKYVESVQVVKQKKPDNIKVILNLVPSRNYDLQQVFFKEDNLFVLFINAQDILPEGKTTTGL
jgi:hypothetical protein